KGHKNIEDTAHQIDPHVPDRVSSNTPHAANQSYENRHANSRGNKILNRLTKHLGEIAHRRFAAVRLPLCVCQKTHSRIKSQVGSHGTKSCGIERQMMLNALDQIEKKETNETRPEDGPCIGLPIHFLFRVNTKNPIEKPFNRL